MVDCITAITITTTTIATDATALTLLFISAPLTQHTVVVDIMMRLVLYVQMKKLKVI